MITDDSLKQIMPNVAKAKRDAFLPHLQSAMNEFEVNNPLRAAAFIAQLAHESGEFRWMEELWGPTAAQTRYEPPTKLAADLGNTQPGDGKRFKGRGPIQITGRDNYQRFGALLGIDLVSNPQSAATPEVGFRVAGLFWQRRGLNVLADSGDFKTITKRINGGFNGLEERLKYYARAKEVLGLRPRGGAGATRGIRAHSSRSAASTDIEFSRGFETIEAEKARTRKTKTSKSGKRARAKPAPRRASRSGEPATKKTGKKTAGKSDEEKT